MQLAEKALVLNCKLLYKFDISNIAINNNSKDSQTDIFKHEVFKRSMQAYPLTV